MVEKPINFADWQVRAADRIRRVTVPVVPQPRCDTDFGYWYWDRKPGKEYSRHWSSERQFREEAPAYCPYPPGTVLWVRETWCITRFRQGQALVEYCADGSKRWCNCPSNVRRKYQSRLRWRSPVTMPKWASRFRFRVVGVDVRGVGEITEDDVWAEGVEVLVTPDGYIGLQVTGKYPACDYYKKGDSREQLIRAYFASAWDARWGKDYPWAGSPWAWALSVTQAKV